MTQNLKEVYSSNKEKRTFEAIVIENPYFSKTYYLVNDTVPHDFNYNGSSKHFEVCPFELNLPTKGEEQQDVEITLPNIGIPMIKELDSALEDIFEPVMIHFLVYLDGFSDPQGEIPNLEFTNVVIDRTTVSGIGMRKDLFGHYINENQRFDIRFEGLFL